MTTRSTISLIECRLNTVTREWSARGSTDVSGPSVGISSDSDNGDPDDNGQSGSDPHPENDSNLANFHFISSLSRRHDMSHRQPQKLYTMS